MNVSKFDSELYHTYSMQKFNIQNHSLLSKGI